MLGREDDSKTQYKETLSFKSEGGFMRIKKILQDEPHKHKTIVLIPGWCESFKIMENIALGLVKAGYNIFVLDYQHLDDLAAAEEALKNVSDSIPQNEYIKALSLVKFLKESELKDVHIVAHSEGSVIGTLACSISNQSFSSLTLVNPACFIHEESFFRLSLRFIYSTYKQDVRNFSRHLKLQLLYTLELLSVLIKNPIQSFKDGYAMSKHSIIAEVERLSKINEVHLVFNDEDILFPIHKLRAASKSISYNSMHNMKGGHNELYIHTSKFVSYLSKILK
jgi:pimeloyl-ACP methyl ester carboxylesterase